MALACDGTISESQSTPFDVESVFENANLPPVTRRSAAAVISQGSPAQTAAAAPISFLSKCQKSIYDSTLLFERNLTPLSYFMASAAWLVYSESTVLSLGPVFVPHSCPK